MRTKHLKTRQFIVKVPHQRITIALPATLSRKIDAMPKGIAEFLGVEIWLGVDEYTPDSMRECAAIAAADMATDDVAEIEVTLDGRLWEKVVQHAAKNDIDLHGYCVSCIERRVARHVRYRARQAKKAALATA